MRAGVLFWRVANEEKTRGYVKRKHKRGQVLYNDYGWRIDTCSVAPR